MTDSWNGRFPQNEISSLLQVNRRLNLAESTSKDLFFGELIDIIGFNNVKDIRLGYGSAEGSIILREEVAKLCNISANCIISTNGTSLGLYLLAIELCRSGDEVVLFTPCFPPSKNGLISNDVVLKELKLRFENGYQVDMNEFESILSNKTKLVSIASPQNPSGVVTDKNTIKKMISIMKEKCPDAFIFIDETYNHATHGNNSSIDSFASLDHKVITGSSVSKAFGAPGLRVGWLTVQDKNLRDRIITAKINIVISGSPLDETLAAYVLRNKEKILHPRGQLLKTGVSLVENWQVRNKDFISWVKPTNGALCTVKLRNSIFSNASVMQFWKSLEKHELQLANGEWFGEDHRTFRLGFGYLPLEHLKESLEKLEKLFIELT